MHAAQVARGRISCGSPRPSSTTASWARPTVRCRNPSGSKSGRLASQNSPIMARIATSAARAPSAWPPMPSTTTRNADPSPTAMATRSWFSSRFPRRLRSACSICKCRSSTPASHVDSCCFYNTPRCITVSGPCAAKWLDSRQFHPDAAMIRSMTGFARRERQGPWGTLTCELRTVNHRYLEVSLRLPEDLRGLENDARQLVGASLRRGKVDAGLYLRSTAAAPQSLELNRPLVEQLLQRAAEVGGILGDRANPMSALEVLRWPGVVREAERDVTPLAGEAIELLRETVEHLNESRAREGARIREMLETRCQALVEGVALVRARLPEISARIRAKVAERVAQLGTQVDPERLEQELVLLAYKMDVEEELDRLGSHVTETMRVLDSTEAAGRRLDFLMQELNREANTLSSKSQDVEMTRAAVDMKVLIEQMREQVQNVE